MLVGEAIKNTTQTVYLEVVCFGGGQINYTFTVNMKISEKEERGELLGMGIWICAGVIIVFMVIIVVIAVILLQKKKPAPPQEPPQQHPS